MSCKKTKADELFNMVPIEISKIKETERKIADKKTKEMDKYISWRSGILEISTRKILEMVPKRIAESRNNNGQTRWVFITNLFYSDNNDLKGHRWRCKDDAERALLRDINNENYNLKRSYGYYEMKYCDFIKLTREEREFIKNEFKSAGFIVKKTFSWRLVILDRSVSKIE